MSDGKRRILVLSIWEEIWSLVEGGGVADEDHFIRELTAEGLELHFLVPDPGEGRGLAADGRIHCHTYPNIFRFLSRVPGRVTRLLWPVLFPIAAGPALWRAARRLRPSLLLGFTHHTLHPLYAVGRYLGIPTAVKLFGVMYLGRFDMPPPLYIWRSLDQVVALKHPVDHYIVLNDGTRGGEALERLGIPRERISVLPNGMDTRWVDIEVDRAAVRRSMGLSEERLLVVTVSRLIKLKRVDLFLEAASRLDPSVRARIELVVAGDGPERSSLEARSRRLGLGESVRFTGALTHGRVMELLGASDIFVGTSELTNMSLPPCEAVLSGVPVVAFDVSGTGEVVRDGETGLLVPFGDLDGLARAVASLVEDDGLRARLSRDAAAFGRGHFVSWRERVVMELEVIERLTAGS